MTKNKTKIAGGDEIVGHLVNPCTLKWFHYDKQFRLWSCDCTSEKSKVSLCLSICDCLKEEGNYNDLRRKVAVKRKELELLEGEDIQTGLKRISQKNHDK